MLLGIGSASLLIPKAELVIRQMFMPRFETLLHRSGEGLGSEPTIMDNLWNHRDDYLQIPTKRHNVLYFLTIYIYIYQTLFYYPRKVSRERRLTNAKGN